jgi:hypothetical protein
VAVRNNILTHNYDNEAGGISKAATTGLGTTGDQKQVFDQYFTWAPEADPASTFSYNVVLPGVRRSSSGASYEDRSGAANFTAGECASFYRGFEAISCVGSGVPGETASERFARAGFADIGRRNFRLRDDSPFKSGGLAPASDGRDMGVDVDALESAMGMVKEMRVLEVTGTEATLSYLAPDGAACGVDYTTDAAFGTLERVSDGGGARARSVKLEGLLPGTMYHYRVQCASEQPKGSFATRGM